MREKELLTQFQVPRAALGSIIAELQRAKRASEGPWVSKIGNPSSRENLVMTSAYERASERPSVRPSVQTLGEGEGRLELTLTVTHKGSGSITTQKKNLANIQPS